MAGQKLLPTTMHEIRRWWIDRRIKNQLKTPPGRRAYWDDLAQQCASRSLIQLLKSTLSLPGNVIECGVFRGGSLMQIAQTVKVHRSPKRVFGLDSFEGFPENSVKTADLSPGRWLWSLQRKFRFCADTPTNLRMLAKTFDLNVELVPGYFCHTLRRVQSNSFCFIHLDVDIYQSYKECLEALYDRLVPGGVIVFDEWESPRWPGGSLAIREFFRGRPETVETLFHGQDCAHYIRKPAACQLERPAKRELQFA
jgi:hypothetical protein